MLGPLAQMWQSAPQLQEYLTRNPNGFLARRLSAAPKAASVPSFAAGGMMGAGGQPIRPGEPMPDNYGAPPNDGGPMMGEEPEMSGAAIEQEANRLAKMHPDVMQQIQAAIAQAIQSGELTPDELNMAVQLAKTALANPASYPQVREFAIKNGLGTEADIPPQMDRGLLLALVVAGKAMQTSGGAPAQGNAMQGQAPAGKVLPEYKDGGLTSGGLAQLHGEEYIATKAAVLYHGKKTYDKLEEQARAPKDGTTGS